MLILTRRVQESLRIGDDIVVTVLGLKGGQIRLGVEAPKNCPVHREEVYLRIHPEDEAAPARTASGPNTLTLSGRGHE